MLTGIYSPISVHKGANRRITTFPLKSVYPYNYLPVILFVLNTLSFKKENTYGQ
jgi:hypothetical protein